MNEPQVSKKTAIVTGGSSGIGEQIVKLLASNGFLVANFDLQQPQTNLSEDSVRFHQVDLNNQSSIVDAVAKVASDWGTIAALVNCAGIYPSIHVDDYTDDLWHQCLAVNLTAPYYLSQAVIPHFKKENKGYIVNITSGSVYLGSRDPGYSASKAGLAGLTKALAKNLAKNNITVNSVAPGPTDTPMSQEGMREDDVKQYISNIPLCRFGEPDEVAEAVYFLISGKADYLTGTTIHVNGGLYLN